MIVSFFSETEYTLWVDNSSDERCIYQEDIDFSPNEENIQLVKDGNTWKIVISNKEKNPETAFEKHNRIKKLVVETIDITTVNLEGETFSDIEIWDIITARVFWGNPYAQMVLQAKVTKALLKQIAGQATESDTQLIQYGDVVTEQVNVVRRVFGLSDM